MGHREDLLAGAKQCIYEKGYARTTARDIVAASGTNLASIGYHFGCKEALLFTALQDAMTEWDAEITRITHDYAPSTDPMSMERAWDSVIQTYTDHRPLLLAQFEAWAQAAHSPEIREQLAATYERNRAETAAAMSTLLPGSDEESARAVATVFGAIAEGLMIQWLSDPDHPPTGRDVRLTFELISGKLWAASASESPSTDGT